MPHRKNPLIFVWMFIVLVNVLVLGPVGWIAKTYHKELKLIKIQTRTLKEEKISKDEYFQDREIIGGRIDTLEDRIYDIIRTIPE